VIDVARGHRELVARTASVAERAGEAALVLSDRDTLLAVIPCRDVVYYETARVVDPEAEVRGQRLWEGLSPGDEVRLVHAGPGMWD
jgi:hypothetical protein